MEAAQSAVKQDRPEREFPEFSTSVNNALEDLPRDERVPAGVLINSLFRIHPEYVHGAAASIHLEESVPSERMQPIRAWVEEVRSLYRPDTITVRKTPDEPPRPLIDGRLFAIGLSYLDQEIGQAWRRDKFLDDLEKEAVREVNRYTGRTYTAIENLLTPDGLSRRQSLVEPPPNPPPNPPPDPLPSDESLATPLQNGKSPSPPSTPPVSTSPSVGTPVISDYTPTLADYATEVDQLGREAFAKALATYIRNLWDEEARSHSNREDARGYNGTFMLDIHGPWGAGKTTLLNFLRKELKAGVAPEEQPERKSVEWNSEKLKSAGLQDPYSRWVVVDFNAWQNQRMGAPWWWMMNSVYNEAQRQVNRRAALRLWITDKWWRFRNGDWPSYLLAVILAALLVYGSYSAMRAFGIFDGLSKPDPSGKTSGMEEFLKLLGGIFGLFTGAVSILGIIVALSRRLLGPARAADNMLKTSRDPMQSLTDHFCKLVRAVGQPVAIFIDDLDRCKPEYVIELLDGIQTLFKSAPVTYVVAADRRWIYTSYESTYSVMATRVNELGRPLGHLFLEKIFQLSAPVPRMSADAQADFLNRLLQTGGAEEKEMKQASSKKKAVNRLDELRNVESILDETKRTGDDPLYDQAYRQEAVKRMATQSAVTDTENMLRPFAHLLEANPRAMKRFVTAYSVYRAVAVLAAVDKSSGGNDLLEASGRKKLALWTIVSLRWPLLAEYLSDNPQMVEQIAADPPVDPDKLNIPVNLRALFKDEDVKQVIKGEGIGESLDPKIVRACALLSTSDAGRGWNEQPSPQPGK
jgi:hypothetical protein